MSKVKFEIKNRWTGSVLFEYEKENNTLKETVEKAIEEGTNLRGADLRGAYLEEAYLGGADLEGADLRGADLEGADLRGADLEGADLEEAYLGGADLEGTDLREAYLEGTNLRGTNLRGADLEGADLEGADLGGAYIYLSDSDKDFDINEVVKNIENNSNLKIKQTYINRNIIPTRWNYFWKYGLIICDWEVKKLKKEVKKMTVSEICKELGYDVEIIKDDNNF